MAKRILITTLLLTLTQNALATDFSGTYQCQLNDHHDGLFKGTLVLTQDATASFPKTGYGSYSISLNVVGMPYSYTGIAAANGNNLGIYFESIGENRDPNDRGVGIATVIAQHDKTGKETLTLHKFYYEKSYKGKSNFGFEQCVKIE